MSSPQSQQGQVTNAPQFPQGVDIDLSVAQNSSEGLAVLNTSQLAVTPNTITAAVALNTGSMVETVNPSTLQALVY